MDKSKGAIGLLVAAIIVILIAIIGLAGYLPGFGLLAVDRGYIPMAPSTACCFILFGAAVILFFYKPAERFSIIVSNSAVAIVSVFGLSDLIGFLIGQEINFEKVLVPYAGALNGVPIARMSPATGAMFFMSGIVFLFINRRSISGRFSKQVDYLRGSLSFMLLLISFVFCLAYFYGSPLLYNIENVIPMAFSTALGFLFFLIAMLIIQRDSFPLNLFFENTTRGYLLRYIIPLAALSVLFGGLGGMLFSDSQGLNAAFVSAGSLVLVMIVAIFVALYISYNIGEELDYKNALIEQSKQAFIESEQQYRTLLEKMSQGVVYQDSSGVIVDANPAAEKILGLSLEQMRGRKSIDPRWKAVGQNKKELPGEEHPAMLALRSGENVENFIQGIFNPKLDSYVWIIVNSIPQFKPGRNEPYQVFSTFLEITKRKNAEDELFELKGNLEKKVAEQTSELEARIAELEHFHDVTVEREMRVEELRRENEKLKKQTS